MKGATRAIGEMHKARRAAGKDPEDYISSAVVGGCVLADGEAFDSPRAKALAGPHADICDLYAFPSPERPGHLVLAMNVLPKAAPSALFSDAIICRFRVRPVTIATVGPAAKFEVAPEKDEIVFDFTFDSPRARDGNAAV